jgi:hypothetical protein
MCIFSPHMVLAWDAVRSPCTHGWYQLASSTPMYIVSVIGGIHMYRAQWLPPVYRPLNAEREHKPPDYELPIIYVLTWLGKTSAHGRSQSAHGASLTCTGGRSPSGGDPGSQDCSLQCIAALCLVQGNHQRSACIAKLCLRPQLAAGLAEHKVEAT